MTKTTPASKNWRFVSDGEEKEIKRHHVCASTDMWEVVMIPKGKGLPRFADDATLNQIRGKAMVGHQTIEDVWTLLDHLQLIEHILDEEVDTEDGLGTEGWRHHAESVSAGFR